MRGRRAVVVAFRTADEGKKADGGGGQEEELYFSHIFNFKGERIE